MIPRRIGWLARWLNFRAAVLTLVAGRHYYLSTSCLHGEHEHCRSAVNVEGASKSPGTCKFCPAVCRCTTCNHSHMS